MNVNDSRSSNSKEEEEEDGVDDDERHLLKTSIFCNKSIAFSEA